MNTFTNELICQEMLQYLNIYLNISHTLEFNASPENSLYLYYFFFFFFYETLSFCKSNIKKDLGYRI